LKFGGGVGADVEGCDGKFVLSRIRGYRNSKPELVSSSFTIRAPASLSLLP